MTNLIKEIKEMTNGQLIVKYAEATAKFYRNINQETSVQLNIIQNELLDRNIITLNDMAVMV